VPTAALSILICAMARAGKPRVPRAIDSPTKIFSC
jgi:hypothetical protein